MVEKTKYFFKKIMKKILFSLFTIFTCLAVVSLATSSYFTAQATASGLTIRTGNADLLIGLHGAALGHDLTTDLVLENLYPGYNTVDIFSPPIYANVDLKNNSSSPIPLRLSFKLTKLPNEGETELFQAAQVNIATEDGADYCGWVSLSHCALTSFDLPGDNLLLPNETKTYRVGLRIPYNYGEHESDYPGKNLGRPVGNEIKDQSLTGVEFTFTGTQQD